MPLELSRNTAASLLATYERDVPGIATYRGGPVVTMMAAGVVDSKIVGTSFGVMDRPGICFFTAAKLASAGKAENEAGSFPAGTQGPVATGAISQAPLSRRYQLLEGASKNTSQFVFTANDSEVPAIGARSGSPSNTMRLAGLVLTKMRGGLLSRETSGGCSARWSRLSTTIASGTRLGPTSASSALIRSSNCAARAVSTEGKLDDRSRGALRITTRSKKSICVVNSTLIVPATGTVAPLGRIATAIRVSSVRCSGQAITWG